jgi:hypothetical protein
MPPIVSSSGSHFGSTLPHILGASGKTTIFLLIIGRWMAKLVARLLATAALWVRIQTSLKQKTKRRHKQRSAQHILARQKDFQKKFLLIFIFHPCKRFHSGIYIDFSGLSWLNLF